MVSMYHLTHRRPLPPPRKFKRLTERVIKVLTPEVKKGMVTVKDCVIFGKKRSGKTWLEKAIAERIVEQYGEENVSVYISNSLTALVKNIDKPTNRCTGCGKWGLALEKCENCGELIPKPDRDKLINVLIVDDPLRRYLSRGGTTREQRNAIGDFEAIAHRLEEKLTSKTGVGIIIIGSQQYKGLEKTFRDAPVVIFKTEMGEDQHIVNKKLDWNAEAIDKLGEITDAIYLNDKHSKRSESVAKLGGKVGYCVFPPFEEDYCVWVGRRKKVDADRYNLTAQFAREVMKETTIDPDMKNLTKAVRGFLMSKHPDMVDTVKALASDVCDVFIYDAHKELARAKPPAESLNLSPPSDGFKYSYKELKEDLRALLSKTRDSTAVESLLKCHELSIKKYSQEEIANIMVREGLKPSCSQAYVSKMCQKVKGALEYIRGMKYELYIQRQLEKKAVKGLFDKEIARVMRFGEEKTGTKAGNYPDLVVLYKNNDVDVVACKCFNDRNYAVNVGTTREKCDIAPELDTFLALCNNENVSLPNGETIENHGNARLVIMMRCTNEQTPCEAYAVYTKSDGLPRTVPFSELSFKRGLLNTVKWENPVRLDKGS